MAWMRQQRALFYASQDTITTCALFLHAKNQHVLTCVTTCERMWVQKLCMCIAYYRYSMVWYTTVYQSISVAVAVAMAMPVAMAVALVMAIWLWPFLWLWLWQWHGL